MYSHTQKTSFQNLEQSLWRRNSTYWFWNGKTIKQHGKGEYLSIGKEQIGSVSTQRHTRRKDTTGMVKNKYELEEGKFLVPENVPKTIDELVVEAWIKQEARQADTWTSWSTIWRHSNICTLSIVMTTFLDKAFRLKMCSDFGFYVPETEVGHAYTSLQPKKHTCQAWMWTSTSRAQEKQANLEDGGEEAILISLHYSCPPPTGRSTCPGCRFCEVHTSVGSSYFSLSPHPDSSWSSKASHGPYSVMLSTSTTLERNAMQCMDVYLNHQVWSSRSLIHLNPHKLQHWTRRWASANLHCHQTGRACRQKSVFVSSFVMRI